MVTVQYRHTAVKTPKYSTVHPSGERVRASTADSNSIITVAAAAVGFLLSIVPINI
jgi:hypothetical protein